MFDLSIVLFWSFMHTFSKCTITKNCDSSCCMFSYAEYDYNCLYRLFSCSGLMSISLDFNEFIFYCHQLWLLYKIFCSCTYFSCLITPLLMFILCSITLILLRQQRRRRMPVNQTRLHQHDNQLLKLLSIYVISNIVCILPFSLAYCL